MKARLGTEQDVEELGEPCVNMIMTVFVYPQHNDKLVITESYYGQLL